MSTGQGSVLRIQDWDLGNRELSPISVRRERGAGRKWDVKKDRVGGGAGGEEGRRTGQEQERERGPHTRPHLVVWSGKSLCFTLKPADIGVTPTGMSVGGQMDWLVKEGPPAPLPALLTGVAAQSRRAHLPGPQGAAAQHRPLACMDVRAASLQGLPKACPSTRMPQSPSGPG